MRGEKGEKGVWDDRLKELERRIKLREREERRSNIVLRVVEDEEERREVVEG